MHDGQTPATFATDADVEPTARERAAVIVEHRLDVPMAILAAVWAALVAYELVAPHHQRGNLTLVGNVIWGVFVLEFVAKLWVSGHPLRFVRRRWPALLFLLLPALRVLRLVRSLRALRVLPAVRVVGSSYRAIGSARAILSERLVLVAAVSLVTVFSGGQLLYLVEGDALDASLGDALWWAANLALGGSLVFEPTTAIGRVLSVLLGVYAVIVVGSVAASLGAFFVESRTEEADAGESNSEESTGDPIAASGGS